MSANYGARGLVDRHVRSECQGRAVAGYVIGGDMAGEIDRRVVKGLRAVESELGAGAGHIDRAGAVAGCVQSCQAILDLDVTAGRERKRAFIGHAVERPAKPAE